MLVPDREGGPENVGNTNEEELCVLRTKVKKTPKSPRQTLFLNNNLAMKEMVFHGRWSRTYVGS